MDGYDHETEIGTRFRDLDTNGHVNNAVYVSYLEQARAAYFADVIGVPLPDAGAVLAELSVTFEAPISLGDAVTVGTRVPAVGDGSVPIENAVHADGELAATAEMTLVPIDEETGDARPVPDRWRERIRRHEPW